MLKILVIFITLIITWSFGINQVTAFWKNLDFTRHVNGITLVIGQWEVSPPPFDESFNYEVGDSFSFDNSVWIVTESWFNPSNFLNPDGTINFSYVRTWGPVQELTPFWRSYNTYDIGDTVVWNDYEWVVNHFGANSVEPGTDTNAWNKITDHWFIYNTYSLGDIVIFNNQQWIAISSNRSREPDMFSWAWQLLD